MHDPMTVAHKIKYPWKNGRTKSLMRGGYRESFLTIWHRDPEKDGSDDSCGYSFYRLSADERSWAEKTAGSEWKFWFCEEWESINLLSASNTEVVAAAWSEVKNRIHGIHRAKPLTGWDVAQVLGLCSCPGDNFGHIVRDAKANEEGLANLLALTLRFYVTKRRPWWRHPKWHIHHWKIQIHPVQKFKRWAWSRCSQCGKGFGWGASVYTGQWNSSGPRWFRGEPNAYHSDCYPNHKPGATP